MKEDFRGATGRVSPAPAHAPPGAAPCYRHPSSDLSRRNADRFSRQSYGIARLARTTTITVRPLRPRERPHSPAQSPGPKLIHITPGATRSGTSLETPTACETTTSAVPPRPAPRPPPRESLRPPYNAVASPPHEPGTRARARQPLVRQRPARLLMGMTDPSVATARSSTGSGHATRIGATIPPCSAPSASRSCEAKGATRGVPALTPARQPGTITVAVPATQWVRTATPGPRRPARAPGARPGSRGACPPQAVGSSTTMLVFE